MEKLRNLPVVTQQISGEVGFEPKRSDLKFLALTMIPSKQGQFVTLNDIV